MPLNDWFATVELDKPTPTQQAVLDELARMLDHAQPTRLDRHASSIQATGHGWVDADIGIRLVHAEDADATIEIGLGEGTAIIVWLTVHEHIDADDPWTDEPWPVRVVDAVAAVLGGGYEVEDTWRGHWLVRSRIVDVADPAGARVISTTGSLLSCLPLPGRRRVERRRLSFGIRSE